MERLDDGRERDTLLLELILSFLDESTRHELEEEMELQTTKWFSKMTRQSYADGLARGQREGMREGRRKGLEEGMRLGVEEGLRKSEADGLCKGRRKAIVLLLRSRGLEPTRAQRRRLDRCIDLKTLDAWLRRAASVDQASQLFAS
ncbi:Yae1 family protein [Paraliomyxa miuraensis]|uniref:Yae1 family protein n=1 Tax=Paraliomyxa miuraensis TaxID=376150 RepID=UPI00225A1FDA|nr:Yae1 family protein [Paraliomyxa miuraensis]MCX4244978.1 Yae1 family protein [Paraliomyxa miuraensis]